MAGAGRKWVTPGLILQARPRTEDGGSAGDSVRVGFTVSRKVGNAVARNRVRRRLRATADDVMPRCARKGHDFVVIGRAATLKRPFRALCDDLETALKRLHAHRRAAARPGGAKGRTAEA